MPPFKTLASVIALTAWAASDARAQLMLDGPKAYSLLPTATPPRPYQGMLGSAVFLSTSVDSLNALQLLGFGYLVVRQAEGPQPAPPFPAIHGVISKSGTPITTAPVEYGAPEWRTSTSATGEVAHSVWVPFSFLCSRPYSPEVMTAGSYKFHLADGTNIVATTEFVLTAAAPLPPINLRMAGDFCVVSWLDSASSGLVTLQQSDDLKQWTTVAFGDRSAGSVTNVVGTGPRFYRLRSGL